MLGRDIPFRTRVVRGPSGSSAHTAPVFARALGGSRRDGVVRRRAEEIASDVLGLGGSMVARRRFPLPAMRAVTRPLDFCTIASPTRSGRNL